MKGLPSLSLGGSVLGGDGEVKGRERLAVGMGCGCGWRWRWFGGCLLGDGVTGLAVMATVAVMAMAMAMGDGRGNNVAAVDSLSEALEVRCETGSVGRRVEERLECVSCAVVCPWSPRPCVASRTLSTEEKTG
ncbi:hypothetical protein P153DRAFT_224374 [Dothidotthia symphoricarpi CBS 119687]|uniref:Uncharacterized protein n=1 Tax=Dothidotthia symphoricarpi CBS 119687 TaxID=1392245 RepID=A0A6A6AFI2_9PLEO|nr:uncharacterized protein P153DRAFT_224374 [Dothidotthia symphoricarpi CBS 119687]KAF2129798.1 hypothetical protein P153DRAFT_224374 [Dothidotthia symphoricarpi CBS 119687]